MDSGSELAFSLTRGGPFFKLLRAVGLVRPGHLDAVRSGIVVALFAWVPFDFLAAVSWSRSGKMDPILIDPAVHVRLLLAVPLFFVAEAVMDDRCSATYRQLVQGYVRQREDAAAIAGSAERWRDSRLVEAGMLGVVVAAGLATLWSATGPSGLLKGASLNGSFSPAVVWYAVFGLPLFQFLLLRLIYRWVIWSRMLVALSRIDLDLVPTHPDSAGGLACVTEPLPGYGILIVAMSAVVAATWGYQIAVADVPPPTFAAPLVALVIGVLVLGLGPMLSFTRRMLRARLEAVRQYAALARRHARLFHERWIIEHHDSELLGSPDKSSLIDLESSYENLVKMRIVPFGPRQITMVLACVVAPMLPVLALKKPLPELFLTLARTLLGGGFRP